MRRVQTLIVLLATFLTLNSTHTALGQPKGFRAVATPRHAQAAAWKDLQTLAPHERRYTRYVWVKDGRHETVQSTSLFLNIPSRAEKIQRPLPLRHLSLDGVSVVLQRVNLTQYAAVDQDIVDWVNLWEDLQFDPDFSTYISKETLAYGKALFGAYHNKAFITRISRRQIEVPPYVHTDGKTYTARWEYYQERKLEVIKVEDLKDIDLVRLPGQHLDLETYWSLVYDTGSMAPVVSDVYAGNRLTRSVQDDGDYALLYGGRYYEFSGTPLAGKLGSDEDALFLQLGLALDLEKGIRAEQLLDRLRSDRRVALAKSEVTGRPRRIDFLRTGTGGVDDTISLLSVTQDLRQQDINRRVHPLLNLLKFKAAGKEGIYQRKNGLQGYYITNGDGKRLNEVPSNVANDRTIPAPYPPRLDTQSCIACHETEGSDGWKAARNDVKKLVGALKGLDIFGDLGAGVKSFDGSTVRRLQALYDGDPERALVRARDDYARAVLAATGPWKEGADKGQANVVKLATGHLVKRLREHTYGMVGAQTALRDLGVEISDAKQAPDLLKALLPPDTRTRVYIEDQKRYVVLEDALLALLKEGVEISRQDWDQSYSYAAERSSNRVAQFLKDGRPPQLAPLAEPKVDALGAPK